MTRNLVSPETAEQNRSDPPGRYTFHAPIEEGYEGLAFTVAVVRIGDHAHVEIESGRAVPRLGEPSRVSRGRAGRLRLRWEEWIVLRDHLEEARFVHIAEVENPTIGQIRNHAG